MKKGILLLGLFLLFGCGDRTHPDSHKVPGSKKSAQTQGEPRDWKILLPSLIPYPTRVVEKGDEISLIIQNTQPLTQQEFEELLIGLVPKVCRADFPFHQVFLEASGVEQTFFKTDFLLADVCGYSRGEISKPELLRRFRVEVVETPESVKVRALAARKEQKNEEARQALEKWISFDPKATLAYSLLGNIHRDEKRYWDAIRQYQKITEIEPDSLFAWHNLGFCYDRVGAYGDAIAAYGKALEKKPSDPMLVKQLALAHQKNGDRRLVLDLIATQNPSVTDSEFFLIAGNVYREDKQYPKAVEAYQNGLKLSPNDHRFLFNLILLDLDQKKFTEARKRYEELKGKDLQLADELAGVPVFQTEGE